MKKATMQAGVVCGGIALVGTIMAAGAGCADYPSNVHGPRSSTWTGLTPGLVVHNETDSRLRIFPWVGRVNAFDPSGASDFRRKGVFEVEPWCKHRVSLGSMLEPTSTEDGIIRIGVLELDEQGRGGVDYEANTRWFEFEQPRPYEIRVTGNPGALEFESVGESGIVELSAGMGEG